jgi:hypothetical protein
MTVWKRTLSARFSEFQSIYICTLNWPLTHLYRNNIFQFSKYTQYTTQNVHKPSSQANDFHPAPVITWKMWICLVFFPWLLNEMSGGGCFFVLLFAKNIFVHVSINSIKVLKICVFKKSTLMPKKKWFWDLNSPNQKTAANWINLTFNLSIFYL